MRLIIIYGETAVGKLTVAKEVARKTGYALLHNHMTINVALDYFPFRSKPFLRLIRGMRLLIVKELLAQKVPGVIWTTGFPKAPGAEIFYKKIVKLLGKAGGINYVRLVCDDSERARRVVSEERIKYGKPNNVSFFKKEETTSTLDFFALAPESQNLRIDNTRISPQKVAMRIIRTFDLQKIKKENINE